MGKHQPPRPPTLCYGATPLHMRGELLLTTTPPPCGRHPFASEGDSYNISPPPRG
ncbi:MAG: hypothetical protein LBB23_02055 [Rickettsiales bacterium]|nr:hypothetical protein [Rickettsiales bacterium]